MDNYIKEQQEKEATDFVATFYDKKRADAEAQVTALLAAASINILSITETIMDGGGCGYIINYEFQWKSRGNYIWSKSSYIINNYYEVSPNIAYAPVILDRVMRIRDILEDPNDRGKYYYLEGK